MGIVVFVEQRGGHLRKASLEALSEARRLAAGSQAVTAVVIGHNVKPLTVEINKIKPDKIIVADDAQFAEYSTEAYSAALAAAVRKENPRCVLASHTAMAKDLIPRVAARLDAPCLSDVIELRATDAGMQVTRPMYSGKTRAVVETSAPLSFFTLRPNVFTITESGNGTQTTLEELTVKPVNVRAKVTATHAAAGTKVELSEAAIIVSGGRGIKGPENWPVLQNLCDVLGAALGASRAVVDAGWIDHQHQVGQTGKTVSPQLYIACGISGAIQHLAGMSSSKIIVAINNNPDAPIFKHATYGIVGDVFEVVPKLTEELKRQLKSHN